MLTRWQGGFAAVVVTLIACGLVIGDIADRGFRRWWLAHAITTDTVAGLLVLLITVLIADQLVSRRQLRDRSRAIAAQAAIIVGQASRSSKVVCAALLGSGDRETANDEMRTYMLMLLVSSPTMIDATVSRDLLELAQSLGGDMARALLVTRAKDRGKPHDPPATLAAQIGQSYDRVRDAAAPLLQVLDLAELIAAGDTQDVGQANVSGDIHDGSQAGGEGDAQSV
jgi:hypothetical protein